MLYKKDGSVDWNEFSQTFQKLDKILKDNGHDENRIDLINRKQEIINDFLRNYIDFLNSITEIDTDNDLNNVLTANFNEDIIDIYLKNDKNLTEKKKMNH